MKRLTQEATENLAKKFRVENGLSLCEPIHVKSLLRKLNILTMYKPLSEDFYGVSLKSPSGLHCLLINSNNTRGRQHYTIAHEIYHILYDEDPVPHICGQEGGKNMSEQNADAFSAELLMPYDGLIPFISEEEIKTRKIKLATIIKLEQYFSVSRISLLHRLKSLKLLLDSNFDALSQIPVKESARQYGYDTALYSKGNENLVISDFGEKARELYERNIISEGHYEEVLALINYGKD
jgi:Zn-dependent peptidase ImmA (M78 family)